MMRLTRVMVMAWSLLLIAILCPTQISAHQVTGLNEKNQSRIAIACTRASHKMDPAAAKRLASVFCEKLVDNFPPLMGRNFSLPGYPSDLSPLSSQVDYPEMERAGLIAELEFVRATGQLIDGRIITEGTKEQCLEDNCTDIMHSIVNRCEWNSHSYVGLNSAFTKCGTYTFFIQNCTNNAVDWNCRRWNKQYQPTFTEFPPFASTIIGPNTTDIWRLSDVVVSGSTTRLPLSPSTDAQGSLTMVPFTPTPEPTAPSTLGLAGKKRDH